MPTVSDVLVPKRKSTMDLWTEVLEARMSQIHQLLDSITLTPLGHTKITSDLNVSAACGDRGDPPVEASCPIPRGHMARPLGLQGLWHWTGDYPSIDNPGPKYTDIWGLARGSYDQPIWAKLHVVFSHPTRVLKVWIAQCTFRDLCRELKREPKYFWTTLGEDISRVVATRKSLYDQARGWETEMFRDNKLLIEAGILKPLDLAGPESFPRMGR